MRSKVCRIQFMPDPIDNTARRPSAPDEYFVMLSITDLSDVHNGSSPTSCHRWYIHTHRSSLMDRTGPQFALFVQWGTVLTEGSTWNRETAREAVIDRDRFAPAQALCRRHDGFCIRNDRALFSASHAAHHPSIFVCFSDGCPTRTHRRSLACSAGTPPAGSVIVVRDTTPRSGFEDSYGFE